MKLVTLLGTLNALTIPLFTKVLADSTENILNIDLGTYNVHNKKRSNECPIQDYSCCTNPKAKVRYTDKDGDWGVENGEWCFINSGKEDNDEINVCPIKDYPCCANINAKVRYTDKDGDWGVENSQWCLIWKGKNQEEEIVGNPIQLVNDDICTRNYGFPCCRETKKVKYTDSTGSWSVEDGQWCLMYEENDEINNDETNNDEKNNDEKNNDEEIIGNPIQLVNHDICSRNYGFPCCRERKEVEFTDSIGSWSSEEGQRCLIYETVKCKNRYGYPVCSKNVKDVHSEDNGEKYGIENDRFCVFCDEENNETNNDETNNDEKNNDEEIVGNPFQLVNHDICSRNYGFPCCRERKEVEFTDSIGSWSSEEGQRCLIYETVKCKNRYDYPVCSKNVKDIYSEDNGEKYGIENDRFCFFCDEE